MKTTKGIKTDRVDNQYRKTQVNGVSITGIKLSSSDNWTVFFSVESDTIDTTWSDHAGRTVESLDDKINAILARPDVHGLPERYVSEIAAG